MAGNEDRRTDAKVYIDGDASGSVEADTAAFGEKAEVVDSFENATAAIFHAADLDDKYELFVEDAFDAGVPTIIIYDGDGYLDNTNVCTKFCIDPAPSAWFMFELNYLFCVCMRHETEE